MLRLWFRLVTRALCVCFLIGWLINPIVGVILGGVSVCLITIACGLAVFGHGVAGVLGRREPPRTMATDDEARRRAAALAAADRWDVLSKTLHR